MTVRPLRVVFTLTFAATTLALTAVAETATAQAPTTGGAAGAQAAPATPAAPASSPTTGAPAGEGASPAAGAANAAEPPKTSGSPEFDSLIIRYDEIRDKLGDLQIRYKESKPEARDAMVAEFEQLLSEGKKLQPQLLKAAEDGFKANPKGIAFGNFLAAYALSTYERGEYDEALRVADELIARGFENKRIYNLAGKAAYNVCDFEKAQKDLTIARDASALDGRADGLLQNVAAYIPLWKKEQEIRAQEAKDASDPAKALPRVLLKTNKGDVTLELFENEAPNTVANFISLVEKGFYNGLTFHRVINEFMAQGGDPKGNGSGGPDYMIPCECYQPNHRLHFRGSLSMAHAGKDTGGSQFFITFVPTPNLDGNAVNPKNIGDCHTVFGRVVEGMDVLAKLTRRQPSNPHSMSPATPQPPADKIIEAKVLRKRNHPYEPKKITPPGAKEPDSAAAKAPEAKEAGSAEKKPDASAKQPADAAKPPAAK